jgi:glycosyltransferase involved in cell wall biosynthesis
MKILFVCGGNNRHGISPIVKNQGESLKKNGVDLDYFTIVGKGTKGYLNNILRLRRFLGSKSYDLIHAHYGLCGIVSELSRKTQKLVVSFMGDDLLGSNKIDGSYTLKSKLLIGINKYLAINRYDFNIVKSSELRRKLKSAKKISIIPNGVDLRKFYPLSKDLSKKHLKTDEKTKIILFAANPERKEKNYSLAKNSCKLLDLGKIRLKPVYNLDQKILNLHYNTADILLLTSFHEGSPNVIKEAMACNCPIVSTDVGDVREVLGNTEGCYVTSYDPEDVAEKIKMAIQFGKRTNGRRKIEHLESGVIANKIIDVYKKVLS